MKKYELTVKSKNSFPTEKISSSADAYRMAKKFYHEDIDIYESAFILMLNRANKTIGWAKISQGGVAGTVVDPIIIYKYCIDCLASSFIIFHNHPSGALKPSFEDYSITKKLKAGAELLNIDMVDHIILTSESFYSMADNCEI